MSSVRAELSGDTEALLARLGKLGSLDKRGAMSAIGEGLRTSTYERFAAQRGPEGVRWKPSIRARQTGGKTLVQTGGLRNSIHTEASDSGVAVGTNDIRAATHQFGDARTIRAKNKKHLVFQVGGQWRKAESVNVAIPARPFLGISDEDEQEIRETIEGLLKE